MMWEILLLALMVLVETETTCVTCSKSHVDHGAAAAHTSYTGCRTHPSIPQNAHLQCSQYSGTCVMSCLNGYQFPSHGGLSTLHLKCQNDRWIITELQSETAPNCEPVCHPPCQNGHCRLPNICQCTPGYEGPQCQMKKIDPSDQLIEDYNKFENNYNGHQNSTVAQIPGTYPSSNVLGGSCRDPPALNANSRVYCSQNKCKVQCFRGYRTTGGSISQTLVCSETGTWVDDRTGSQEILKCEPVCNLPCQNGGHCTSPDACTCGMKFRGPQCQYSVDACDPRTHFNGGYNCTSYIDNMRCVFFCPAGTDFDRPSAAAYTCDYAVGQFSPSPIPQCRYGDAGTVGVLPAVKEDICSLPKDPGPCKAGLPYFYYDHDQGICKLFYYSGCEGNRNRFATWEECESYCSRSESKDTGEAVDCPSVSAETIVPSSPVDLTITNGRRYLYGGMTAHLKWKRPLCANGQIIGYRVLYTADATLPDSYWQERMVHGDKKTWQVLDDIEDQKVYFIKVQARNYRGYGCFQPDLLSYKAGEEEPIKPKPEKEKPIDICLLPKKTGSCGNVDERFYFNPAEGLCQPFVYGGCEGNENNFKSWETCEQECGKKLPGIPAAEKEECGNVVAGSYVPTAPHNLTATAGKKYLTGGIQGHAKWRPPKCPNGDILGYQILYTEDPNQQDKDWESIWVPGNTDLRSSLEDLQQGKRYFIKIQAKNQKGYSPFSEIISYKAGELRPKRPSASNYPPSCANHRCPPGKECFMQQFQCIGTPCYPEPACRAKRKDQCSLPMDVGPCTAGLPRYYHNHTEAMCKLFYYGGCEGNSNNFLTWEECEERCQSEMVANTEERCPYNTRHSRRLPSSIPVDKVGVTSALDCKEGKVSSYVKWPAPSCPNGQIVGYRIFYTTNPDLQDSEWFLKMIDGDTRHATFSDLQYSELYYIKIQAQNYNGYGKSDNSFLQYKAGDEAAYEPNTAPSCSDYTCPAGQECYLQPVQCVRAPCFPVPACRQMGTDVCSLPLDTGRCRAKIPAFHFDHTTNQCKSFKFGGCGGNRNNFLTADTCLDMCSHAENVDICTLPKAPGPCLSNIPRFFFDAADGQCKSFIFGGCVGNANNFKTKDECISRCGTQPKKSAVECPTRCPAVYSPVCGTDSVTYNNMCHLKSAACNQKKDIQFKHPGRCEEHPHVTITTASPVTQRPDYGAKCETIPETPMNSRIYCLGSECVARCHTYNQFPDGTVEKTIICEAGRWIMQNPRSTDIPDCHPVCERSCQNGGRCVSHNTCWCPDSWRGPQCQYEKENCNVKKLAHNGGYKCTGEAESLTCVLSCPAGSHFEYPPSSGYTCTYATGIFSPSQVPQCIQDTICERSCQNGGQCISYNTCRCPEHWRGPQCQYPKANCNVMKLEHGGGYKCTGDADTTTCVLSCPAGARFEYTPSSQYTCNYATGRFAPSHAPKCVQDVLCERSCQNGGRCISHNTCWCPENWRGPQCQYPKDNCRVQKLGHNGGYKCTGDAETTTCVLSCPAGARFQYTPSPHYTCAYATGIFTPRKAPECVYATSGGSGHGTHSGDMTDGINVGVTTEDACNVKKVFNGAYSCKTRAYTSIKVCTFSCPHSLRFTYSPASEYRCELSTGRWDPPQIPQCYGGGEVSVSGSGSVLQRLCSVPNSGPHPHPTSCMKFVECHGYNPFVKECGNGLYFNHNGYCDWPYNVQCGGQVQQLAHKDDQTDVVEPNIGQVQQLAHTDVQTEVVEPNIGQEQHGQENYEDEGQFKEMAGQEHLGQKNYEDENQHEDFDDSFDQQSQGDYETGQEFQTNDEDYEDYEDFGQQKENGDDDLIEALGTVV